MLWKVKNDNEDIQTFNFLITCGLLGVDIRNAYIEQNVKTDSDEIKAWQRFGRMLYPVSDFDNEL
jgi:hypothetical protein